MATLAKLTETKRAELLNDPNNVVMDYVDIPTDTSFNPYAAIIALRIALTKTLADASTWTHEQRINMILRNIPKVKQLKSDCPTLWKIYSLEVINKDAWKNLQFMKQMLDSENKQKDAIVQAYMLERYKLGEATPEAIATAQNNT
jgi:hypothetical protein